MLKHIDLNKFKKFSHILYLRDTVYLVSEDEKWGGGGVVVDINIQDINVFQ